MKLISLNIWGGTLYEPLMAWLAEQAPTTDIFCFQEVLDTPTDNVLTPNSARAKIWQELQALLSDHRGYIAPYIASGDVKGWTGFDSVMGIGLLSKRGLPARDYGTMFVYGTQAQMTTKVLEQEPRLIQHARIGEITVINFHGLWFPGDKGDTADRLAQSQRIREYWDSVTGPKILCGDFNLMPDTESMRMLEVGARNLIHEFHIPTTRNIEYAPDQKYADYTIVTPDIRVKSFTVPQLPISDHYPMVLEFEVDRRPLPTSP